MKLLVDKYNNYKDKLNFYQYLFVVSFLLHIFTCTEHSQFLSFYYHLSFSKTKKWLVDCTSIHFYASFVYRPEYPLLSLFYMEHFQVKLCQSHLVFGDIWLAIFFFAISFSWLCLYKELHDIHGLKTFCYHPLIFLNQK